MGHQPRDSTIAIEERVYPQEPMVSRSGGEHQVGLPKASVNISKTMQEARHGTGTDGEMIADSNVPKAQLAGHNTMALLRLRIFHPKQIVRQQFAEAPMDFADSLNAERPDAGEAAFIDPLLDRNVGFRLKLQVSLSPVVTKVIAERSFYIDRMRVMALNEVRVVTVHRANEVGESGE